MLDAFYKYLIAYRNKITNKLFGVVSLKCVGKKKGNVLLSFITGPFKLTPSERFTDPHSNYWVCPEIARLFLERGYDVDVVDWNNDKFIPKKEYFACVDLHHNLKRFIPYLNKSCKKVMFIVSSFPDFQNNAEEKRLNDLEKRKGVRLPFKRKDPSSDNTEYADFIIGYGNKTVRATYPSVGDKIIPIPVPSMETYDFPSNKDFNKAREHFLWFGGGGAILKGLDLVVEAFSSLPNLKLSIVGPSAYEKEFEEIYKKELSLSNIRRYRRPHTTESGEIITEGRKLEEIMSECAVIIFLSASEGGGGATVQAMHAGLIPIVTPQTGIDENAPSIVIENPTIDNIKKIVTDFSELSPEKIKQMAINTRTFAQKYHTKEVFTKSFGNFIDNTLKL